MDRIRSKTIVRLITMTALATAAAAGCNDGDIGSGDGTVELRAVHASPDAPPVDIYMAGDSEPVISDLAYGEATVYAELPAGEVAFEIRAAGADATSEPVFTTDILALDSDLRVTAVAVGLLGSTSADDRFRIVPVIESYAAAGAGEARVRIVHAGADAPTVGLDVGADGSAEIEGLVRFADTGTDGVALPAGTALRVGIVAGFPLAPVTSFTLPALGEGDEILVVATGLLADSAADPTGFSLLAVTPTATAIVAQDPVVYALHAAPDVGAVDLYTPDTVALALDLEFGDISGRLQVSPGVQPINFWPAGIEHGASPLVAAATPELAAGQRYLLLATGFAAPGGGEAALRLVAVADEFERGDVANARIRIVHGSPDAPSVDVGTVAGGDLGALLAQNLEFSATTPGKGISVAAQPVHVGVAAAGTATIAARFAIAPAGAQRAYAIAAGALSPTAGQATFRLIVVDTASDAGWTATAVHPL